MTQYHSKKSHRWPLLDCLRATAALLVLFAHSRDFYFPNFDKLVGPHGAFLTLFYFITDLGDEAVVIFFVLSGFLVGGSLVESAQRGSFDLAHYLVARFTRIYVVYLPALAITQAIFWFGSILLNDAEDGALTRHQELDFGGVSQAVCDLSGLQGFSCRAWEQNPALWSLGFEWALYLFAPAIILLILWKASPGLRLTAIALVCSIAATLCTYPSRAVFFFSTWYLGVGARRILRAGLVPLALGFFGVGLLILGLILRHVKAVGQFEAGAFVAVGTAIAIACRPLAAFPFAPRFFSWAAGFSYTLYAVHLPIVFLIVAIFQSFGFPRAEMAPSPASFTEFWTTIAICLSAAFLVSLVFESRTEQVRAALLRRCSHRAAPPAPARAERPTEIAWK
ncbi:acyltransferase family protein [Methylocapsa acidiphila]|uniref:acyltransferase family protein n=1 Tax=Methylocapsa acidiphila TaxID=133552 RepID=UPI00040281C5|nr:acyltransferase [Methylocapsa acidiphila]